MVDKPGFWWRNLANLPRFMYRKWRYQRVHLDYRSFLRSELGVIGPQSEPLRDHGQYAPRGTISLCPSATDVMIPAPRVRRGKLPVAPPAAEAPPPEPPPEALTDRDRDRDLDAPEAE
jgi:hypothetical protein